jgi:hypothetical protein
MDFVKFDITDVNPIYDEIFGPVEDDPKSVNYEAVGYES